MEEAHGKEEEMKIETRRISKWETLLYIEEAVKKHVRQIDTEDLLLVKPVQIYY